MGPNYIPHPDWCTQREPERERERERERRRERKKKKTDVRC